MVGLVMDPRFREHRPPGAHPERPERVIAIESELRERGLMERTVAIPARVASDDELAKAHRVSYLDRLRKTVGEARGPGYIDPDTYFGVGTWEAALLAAGSAVDIARGVAAGRLRGGLAVVRPPGHHASRDRAMGFCLLNNAAVAAGVLRDEGLRVAVLDFDVHHGNGTQDIFYDDPRVLYCSTHQYPFYPGTGDVAERGVGAGLGATVNVPLPAGAGDAALLAAYDRIILPAVELFRPDVIIASAGFDAHEGDPIAGMRVSTVGYARLAARLMAAADGKLAAVLEGGYGLAALAESCAALVLALLGDVVAEPDDDSHTLKLDEERALARAAQSLAALPPPSP